MQDTKDWFPKLGPLIKEGREAKGITQKALVEILGYESAQFISILERGVAKIPLKTWGHLIVVLDLNEDMIQQLIVDQYRIYISTELSDGKAQAGQSAPKPSNQRDGCGFSSQTLLKSGS